MKNKKIFSIFLFIAALFIGGYIIYEDRAAPDDPLQDYLNNEGIERDDVNSDEEYIEKEEYGSVPGMLAHDFSLELFDQGENVVLSDYEGQFLIMNMWASWCPPCREEMPELIQFHEDYLQDDQVEIVGINMTTEEKSEEDAEQFINDFQIPFKTLMDVEGEVHSDYEVFYMPMTYIIDPDGRISNRHRGHLTYDMLEGYYEEAVQKYEQN
ncbi:TlpA disulfide reductase family protein [Evansella halocellulosilytica]|uniref:TlpA disulfide reductase family protein n=1 Tax=Evansella halocellulosilytica TaxID=2011013 RepID=UPI0015CB4E62|nr:TlpA disulfide reductase family protein [Evansella halocellulosilytica]